MKNISDNTKAPPAPQNLAVKRVLLPVDILHGKTDTLLYLQWLASEGPVAATLLYVLQLNIEQPDTTLLDEMGREAHRVLKHLARNYLGHENAASLRVRAGRPDEEILAEAEERKSTLILMSSPKPRSWRQFFRTRTVERVVQAAPCPTLVLPLDWAGVPGAAPPQSTPQKIPSGSLRPTWVTAFG